MRHHHHQFSKIVDLLQHQMTRVMDTTRAPSMPLSSAHLDADMTDAVYVCGKCTMNAESFRVDSTSIPPGSQPKAFYPDDPRLSHAIMIATTQHHNAKGVVQ